MEAAVKSRLESVQFEEPQIYKNIVIVPLVAPSDGTVRYHTLGEALATKELTINEVSQSGSVPELMVTNRGNESVLLIDGEELAGAKQNRVLNTSILLKGLWETKIPVSCTEQGRWSYTSKFFSDSGNIMAHKTRARKTSSVHLCLESLGSYGSDQGEVWANISELQFKARAHSPTSAMSDVYKAREEDLRKCDETFKPVANQVGLVAFISGVPAGADIVSRAAAYATVHPKLVRSYALEGLLESSSDSQQPAGSPPVTEASAFTAQARHFLHEIAAAEERQFPSIGHGTDFRYRTPIVPSTTGTQCSSICGTALVHENEVIHAAFFRMNEPSSGESPSSANLSADRSRWRRFTR